jgi:L-lactate dehydrogenase complex protein LldE
MRVALFVPCYVDQLAPDVASATLQLLERLGCSVVYDPEQTCCGQPFLNLGQAPAARRLAISHSERFGEFDAVVTPSASCAATVRLRYPELGVALDGEPRRSRENTFELGEFLVRRLQRVELGAVFPHSVALLESCHGLRDLGLGVASESLQTPAPSTSELLLREVEGLELRSHARPDECCGFGGAFSVEFPEVSRRIGEARLERLAESGAEYVTGTDVSCLLHIDGIRRRTGRGPRAIHLALILATGGGA